ncbi:MAG: hypothetical protein U0U66_10510 [Cytophagaceae bacterium]
MKIGILWTCIIISSCSFVKEEQADYQMEKMETMYTYRVEEHVQLNKRIFNTLDSVILDPLRIRHVRNVRVNSEQLIKESFQLYQELYFINGGRNEDGSFKRPNHTDKIESYFINPENNGTRLVEEKLPRFIELIRMNGGKPDINTIAILKANVFQFDKLIKDKTATGMLYDGTTTLQALIMTSYIMEEILSLEQEFYHQQLLEYTIELNNCK